MPRKPDLRGRRATPEQVQEAKRLYFQENWSYGRIARHLQFSIGTIGSWIRGETHQDEEAVVDRVNPSKELSEAAEDSEARFLKRLKGE